MQPLPNLIDRWQSTLGWQPVDRQQQQFQRLYDLVLAGNQKFNLTRITEPMDFWEKHLWDSLRGVMTFLQDSSYQSQAMQVMDIGTGAGFPGLPVAIVFPTWHITLLDSTRKKTLFLDEVLREMGIPNAATLTDRAEQLASQPCYQAHYDLVLVRAVGAAELCIRYAMPLLKPGGTVILYRGQWQKSDTEALRTIVSNLGGTLTASDQFSTPISQSQRCCLLVQKNY